MSCGIGHRRGSDLALLWLWHRPEATALIGPIAWEPPCAMVVALKRQNKTKKTQKKEKELYVTFNCNVSISFSLKQFLKSYDIDIFIAHRPVFFFFFFKNISQVLFIWCCLLTRFRTAYFAGVSLRLLARVNLLRTFLTSLPLPIFLPLSV